MYLLIYSHDGDTPLAACKDKHSAYTVIRKHYERTMGHKFKCQQEFPVEPVDDDFRDLMAQSMGEDNDKDKESLMPLAITLNDIPPGWTLITYAKTPADPHALNLIAFYTVGHQSEVTVTVHGRPSWVIPCGMDDWISIEVSGYIDKENHIEFRDNYKVHSTKWRQLLQIALS